MKQILLKILLSILALAVLIPVEVWLWTRWISPFFWSPGIAYTQWGWGYVFFGLLFIFVPIGTAGAILETGDDEPNEEED